MPHFQKGNSGITTSIKCEYWGKTKKERSGSEYDKESPRSLGAKSSACS